MICLSFEDYENYGRTAWKSIINCMKSIECNWSVDNLDNLDENVPPRVDDSICNISHILTNGDVISARVCGYVNKPVNNCDEKDIETGKCRCMIFCVDQSCFEVYSSDEAIIEAFERSLNQVGINRLEIGQTIYRIDFCHI